jgi:hypothetical protein
MADWTATMTNQRCNKLSNLAADKKQLLSPAAGASNLDIITGALF